MKFTCSKCSKECFLEAAALPGSKIAVECQWCGKMNVVVDGKTKKGTEDEFK